MERLQQLIELAYYRKHLFGYTLFDSFQQEDRFAELTEQIKEIATPLSIFAISGDLPNILSVQFSDKNIFTSIIDAKIKSKLVDDNIFYSKIVEITIHNGKVNMKLELLYIEYVEEHKKTQAI